MRVLVAEDSTSLADVVADGLRSQGMAVDVAYDGTQAALKLALTSYHVVVLDRSLPGLAGDELCRQIASGEHQAMVLMLSNAVTPEDRVSGLELGADDYLGKPVHFPELVLRVRALARRRGEVPAPVLRRGDVELDPVQHRASRAGRPLDLSPKEFAVLEALMATRAILSAEDLLEQVWDEHADPFTKAVPVTISRLRRKLGAPPVIETVPRVGYRLSDLSDLAEVVGASTTPGAKAARTTIAPAIPLVAAVHPQSQPMSRPRRVPAVSRVVLAGMRRRATNKARKHRLSPPTSGSKGDEPRRQANGGPAVAQRRSLAQSPASAAGTPDESADGEMA